MHTDWSSLSLWFFKLWWFWLIFNKNPPIHSQQIRIWWHANQLINSKHLQRFPEPSKWSQFGSLGYTIMGKTADLTVVQKTIIDTLHKESKTQTFITKEAVHRVLYPSMLTESWVEGKRCTTNRENRSLMRIVKQNPLKNLGELHKEWTEAWVKASRAPHTDVSRNYTVVIRGVLPGLREEELDCCPVVQSPLYRWEQVLYFIWKPRS